MKFAEGGDVTVDKDKQSYFASNEEQMFCAKYNNRNNSNDQFSKMVKNLNAMLENEVEAEARGKIKRELVIVMSAVEHEIKKEYKENKKNRWIVISISLVWFIIVTFLFQFVFDNPKFAGTAILGVVGSVVSFIVEAHSKIGQEIAHIRDKRETITTGIVKVGIAIVQTVKEASLLHLILLLCGTTILGEFFGSADMIDNTYKFITTGYYAVRSKDEDADIVTRVDVEIEANILAEYDETTINMLQQADITQAELNEIIELSQSDYDLVFYLNREDIDWTNRNAVNEAVLQMIDKKRSMQMENKFDKDVSDGGAPQWLRDSVAKASDDENNYEKSDEINALSFSKIRSIRDVRAGAFALFPKRSLANLLSNDYQKLAIILYFNGGNEESIVYYYSQSIMRDFECLQFAENSNDMVKEKLISIKQRYKDIIYTCPNMKGLENAQALAEAFENAANNY